MLGYKARPASADLEKGPNLGVSATRKVFSTNR
jgi:hypothetical protein